MRIVKSILLYLLTGLLGQTLIYGARAGETTATKYTDTETHRGRYFLSETLPGTIGIVEPGGCSDYKLVNGKPHPTVSGRLIYVMEDNIYWNFKAPCVRVVVNHKSVGGNTDGPNYLLFQAIAYYKTDPDTTVFVNRIGRFRRNGTLLKELSNDGVQYTKSRLTVDEFDSVHQGSSKVEESDKLLGFPWHGIPDQGDENQDTWASRERFQSNTPFDRQIQFKSKATDSWLVRFNPYVSSSDDPVAIDIYVHDAAAIAVKVYSPYSDAYGGRFALVLSTDSNNVAALLNGQVATLCTPIFWYFGCK